MHVAPGRVNLNGVSPGAGDATKITDERANNVLRRGEAAEVLLFDLP